MIIRILQRGFSNPWSWVAIACGLATLIYSPGVGGGWLFDDFPNIVDNARIQPKHWGIADLLSAALSSPSSEFKRPLASISFAINTLISGLDPRPMKVTNTAIHLLNGIAAFLVIRLAFAGARRNVERRDGLHAAAVVAMWLVLPINLTAVLYVVQRMESLANLFVLLALWGYFAGRRRMIRHGRGLGTAMTSLLVGSAIGLLAKETAILTPLYAAVAEVILFRGLTRDRKFDWRIAALFLLILVIPGVLGLARLAPILADPDTWATRPFTMSTRLLSELRVVVDYILWSLIPGPSSLSFYHDDFAPSTGWLTPWTTLGSAIVLISMLGIAWHQRNSRPLVSLGIGWFFSCHLLTATVIPLELIYEHRNYFASLGLLLAIVSAARGCAHPDQPTTTSAVRPAEVIMAIAIVYWSALTAYTATRWGNPLSLAEELALRNPRSPRAQYELGRTYVIASRYQLASPYRPAAYRVLERASKLPHSSTLPEQALIFFNAKLGLEGKIEWWQSMTNKLSHRVPSIEDESALLSLTTCAMKDECILPIDRLDTAFSAAMSHPTPSARLLGAYADFAWKMKGDKAAAYSAAQRAVSVEPRESVYRTNLIQLAVANGDRKVAEEQLAALILLNVGGMYDNTIADLRAAINHISVTGQSPEEGSSSP